MLRRPCRALVTLLTMAVSLMAASAAPAAITTFAGDGNWPNGGDGGPATAAGMLYPQSTVVAPDGTFYVADFANNSIRKVSPAGTITLFAGKTRGLGFAGDGGPAVDAILGQPDGLALSSGGELYFADPDNQRVRKVDTDGVITTVAGNGMSGFEGDGGPATSARLNYASAVAVSSDGTLYIADKENGRVRKVTPGGTISTVLASPTISTPLDVAVAADGTLYVADAGNGHIKKVTPLGVVTTLATVTNPSGIDVDAAGNVDVASSASNVVVKVSALGAVTTVAGTVSITGGFSGDGGPAISATLHAPNDVAVGPGGSLYVSDTFNGRVRRVDLSGTISTVAGHGSTGYRGDGGPAPDATLHQPFASALGPDGSLYIADTGNMRIRKISPDGVITTVAGNGDTGDMNMGDFSGDEGPAVDAALSFPAGVAVASDGTVYIADTGNQRIRKVATDGIITTVAGSGTTSTGGFTGNLVAGFSGDGGPATEAQLGDPNGITVGSDGTLYIADSSNNRIRTVGTDGVITTVAGNGEYDYIGEGAAATDAGMNYPTATELAPDGTLYLVDPGNSAVRAVDTAGLITTVAGNGQPAYSGDGGAATDASLKNPGGIALGEHGELYIADTTNNVIRRVSAAGIITTVSGTGENGFSGDGGRGLQARLDSPYDIDVASDGTLYITDTWNSRIRVQTQHAPTASTQAATDVTRTAATLNADVISGDESARYDFQWGETSTYGGLAKGAELDPSDAAQSAAATLADLSAGTTYHYRVVVTNTFGTAYGDDGTFTTSLPPQPPGAVTGAAQAVGIRSASLTGSVNAQGQGTVYRFQYGVSGSETYDAQTPTLTIGSGRTDVAVTRTILDLQPATTYRYRVVASNTAGTSYGDDVTFTTAAAAPPTVATGAATEVTRTTATLNATVDPRFDNGSYVIEYGLTDGYGDVAGRGKVEGGSGAVAASASVTGLTPGTTYHFRVVAENQDGTTYGDDGTVTTALDPPKADVTAAPQDVTETAATVTGAIETGGLETDWHVDYGATVRYGRVTDTVTQTDGGAVTVKLTGLTAGSSYHYRFVVENSDGVRYSADEQLTTVPVAGAPGVKVPPVKTVTPVDPAPSLIPTIRFKRLPNSAAIRVTQATALVRARCDQPVGVTCTATVNLYERVSRAGVVTLNLLGHGSRTMKAGRTRTAVVTVTLTARGRELLRKTAGEGSPALWVTVRLRSNNPRGNATTRFAKRPVRLARQP